MLIFFLTTPTFALDCQDKDERLIKIDSSQIGYTIYNKKQYANKLEKCDYKFVCGLYTDGDWKRVNSQDSKNFNILGSSLCLNAPDYNAENNTYGSYCWCNITEIDNYKVAADWAYIKKFEKYVFDENKHKTNEKMTDYEKERINELNLKDCMNNCADLCQSNLYQSISKVQGYYVCDKALYKIANVKCAVNKKFINAKNISVFETSAQIETDNKIIYFEQDKSHTKDLIYIGEYEYNKVYLKVNKGKIYVGHQDYSLEECM